MDKDAISSFIFDRYVIPKINLIVNPDFQQKEPVEIDFKFKVGINLNEESRQADLRLDVLVFDNAQEKNYPFFLYVRIIDMLFLLRLPILYLQRILQIGLNLMA